MRRIVIVGGSLLVVAALVVLAVLRPWETRTDWSAYPGSPFHDPRQVLAAPSLEERALEIEAFRQDLMAAIDEEFEVVWYSGSTPADVLEKNGFGGTSMLHTLWSPTGMGAVLTDDPAAVGRLGEIFHEVTLAYGGAQFEHTNEIELYTGNPEASITSFGAPWSEPQSTQRYTDRQESPIRGLAMRFATHDTTIPVDDAHEPAAIRDELRETGATLFLDFSAYVGGLLSEKDRVAFTEAVERYDERDKPEPDFG